MGYTFLLVFIFKRINKTGILRNMCILGKLIIIAFESILINITKLLRAVISFYSIIIISDKNGRKVAWTQPKIKYID